MIPKGLVRWVIPIIFLEILLLLFGISPMVGVMIILGIFSMYPMRYASWIGIELYFFFTLLASMHYGLATGLLVFVSSYVAGSLLFDLVGPTFIYDLCALCGIAILASLADISSFQIIGILLLFAYYAGFTLYQKGMGIFDVESLLFLGTNLCWNAFLLWKIAPLIV